MIPLKKALACTNLTHQDVAEHFDVHLNTVNNWINAHTDVGISQYQEILNFFAENLDLEKFTHYVEAQLINAPYIEMSFDPRDPFLRELAPDYLAWHFVADSAGNLRENARKQFAENIICEDLILLWLAEKFFDGEMIMPITELSLTAYNAFYDLQLGDADQLIERNPHLFEDEEAIENALLDSASVEQKNVISKHLQSKHPFLDDYEFDW